MKINIKIKNKLKDNLIFMIERWNWTNKYWKMKLEKENYTKNQKQKITIKRMRINMKI
jgi:hypothetical protein